MNNHLLVLDFDRTIADTFVPSPSDIGVSEAYDLAIRDIFGIDIYTMYHHDLGGLQNREPRELIDLISQRAKELSLPLPVFSSMPQATKTFVDAKLNHILSDISPEWPPLFPGVKEFFQAYQKGKLPVDIAIVSSGHDEFIGKVFQVNTLRLPELIVTSDTIRDILHPKRPKYKPYQYQLALAHRRWKNDNGVVNSTPGSFTGRNQEKPNIMYVGDDPIKDGGLAERARIVFGFVPFVKPGFFPDAEKGQVLIPDFYVLAELLLEKEDVLKRGGSFAEAFLGKPDCEVFPSPLENERPYQEWLENPTHSSRKEMFP